MTQLRARERRAASQLACDEIHRRIVATRSALAATREQLHAAGRAVAKAEADLLDRRFEREQAAIKLAQLADVLESLERGLAAR